MKTLIVAVASIFTLASCGSKPLTERECKTLLIKEEAYRMETSPPEKFDMDFIRVELPKAVSQCVSSQKYSREYFGCMEDAKLVNQMRVCMDEEKSRGR
jgi:hypothetical protein